jgi:hypothetical protein
MNPGTFSVIIPPPAEAGGPQQGGVSLPLPGSEVQLTGFMGAAIFRILFILNVFTGSRDI